MTSTLDILSYLFSFCHRQFCCFTIIIPLVLVVLLNDITLGIEDMHVILPNLGRHRI
jgi:hypothetical protein